MEGLVGKINETVFLPKSGKVGCAHCTSQSLRVGEDLVLGDSGSVQNVCAPRASGHRDLARRWGRRSGHG